MSWTPNSKRLKYQKRLDSYLLWRTGDFFRPSFELDPAGVCAAEAMCNWESSGIPLPAASTEPELLADYVQGKRSRDWHITEWRRGVKEGLFKAQEFLGCLGMTETEFKTAFAGVRHWAQR